VRIILLTTVFLMVGSRAATVEPVEPDLIAGLNRRIQHGNAKLAFKPITGYLQSVLAELNVPVESQVAVFSKTSSQAALINAENPRAIYFNDDVAVAWVRGANALDVAARDPKEGMIFYTLEQSSVDKPQFKRDRNCLRCHLSSDTLGVPGLTVRSTGADMNLVSDHRTPLELRWGGWYVTGLSRRFRHLGNRVGQGWLKSLYDQFDTAGFPTMYSDIAALMVLEHQTRMGNLITRAISDDTVIDDLVDYLFFVDEVSIPNAIIGTSGYTQKFSTLGPYDHNGRSLRQLDLTTRLFRYPCSYMIYSAAFRELPAATRHNIYGRMWTILSGRETADRYARLSRDDRRAITEILQDTKEDWPAEYRTEEVN
jgi:hypothetical protein